MHDARRRVVLSLVLLGSLLVGACEPTDAALPRLTEPAEVLEEAIRTTAELEYVHARLDLAVTVPGDAGRMGYVVDADIDLGRREFHAAVDGNLGIIGATRAQILVVGSDLYMRTEETGRWQRSSIAPGTDPRADVPPNPAIAVALRGLLEDPSIDAELTGVEACGGSQCYQLVATIAPDLIWRVVNGAVFGAPPDVDPGPVDPAIPAVTLEIEVEEATRRLVSIATTIAVDATTADVRVTLSNHDLALRLVHPPPGEVDG